MPHPQVIDYAVLRQPPQSNIIDYEVLSQPAARDALRFARQQGWLDVDNISLEKAFENHPAHPLRAELKADAQVGGRAASLLIAVLFSFLLVTLVLTAVQQTMSLVTYGMWGALGTALALVLKRYPGRLPGRKP